MAGAQLGQLFEHDARARQDVERAQGFGFAGDGLFARFGQERVERGFEGADFPWARFVVA